jgi:hypothetical protein
LLILVMCIVKDFFEKIRSHHNRHLTRKSDTLDNTMLYSGCWNRGRKVAGSGLELPNRGQRTICLFPRRTDKLLAPLFGYSLMRLTKSHGTPTDTFDYFRINLKLVRSFGYLLESLGAGWGLFRNGIWS